VKGVKGLRPTAPSSFDRVWMRVCCLDAAKALHTLQRVDGADT
jgi:hypothetical protein